ncbi:excalibur calcium-binding domain-containing protein [Neobacillus sp. NRS-1170]|uniref:excalibur calcium-binding domain-containing protein n=1 Tax=Neobacillus sp. NRS-1170 TaxID=3233898 RepID=UPI003D2BBC33
MKKTFVLVTVLLAAILLGNQPKALAFTDMDCKDFSSKQAVMDFWYSNGYSASNDPHRLDGDNDGYPCEVTAGDYSSFISSKSTSGTKTTTSTGWKNINGKWYYYSSGVKRTGWLSYSGSWYYLDSTGVMKTGWVKVGTNWYFFNSSGTMKTGWLLSGGKWYFLDTSGTMKTGWVKVSNLWYFFDSSGVMKTGWVKSGSDWYYLNANGTMKTGWLQSGGKWYYLNPTSGKMALGWNNITGKTYYFYSTGIMAVNTTIEGKQIGADGAVVAVDPTLNKIKEVATPYGVTVEYDAENAVYDLYDGDEYIASVVADGIVYADAAHEELFKKLALALGAPVTEAELNDLIAQAKASETSDIDTGSIYIAADETGFVIVWGTAYSAE